METAVWDVARAQFQPSSAVVLQREPPDPGGEHSSHTPLFIAGQKLPGMSTTRLRWHLYLAPAQSSAGKHLTPCRGCLQRQFSPELMPSRCTWGNQVLPCTEAEGARRPSWGAGVHWQMWCFPARQFNIKASAACWFCVSPGTESCMRQTQPTSKGTSFPLIATAGLPGAAQGMHKGQYLGRVSSHTTDVFHTGQQISNKDKKSPVPF